MSSTNDLPFSPNEPKEKAKKIVIITIPKT
jgi:hypothetical protein